MNAPKQILKVNIRVGRGYSNGSRYFEEILEGFFFLIFVFYKKITPTHILARVCTAYSTYWYQRTVIFFTPYQPFVFSDKLRSHFGTWPCQKFRIKIGDGKLAAKI